jgi:uncharacterized membrane protein HdeD (DUF308 family)
MANQQLDMVRPAVARTVRDHWILYLIEGIILVLLGLLAAFVPPLVGTILFGWLFLVSGIAGLITTFMTRHAPGFWWSLLSSILAVGVGLILFVQPELGTATLTFLLIAFLVLEGIVTTMFALDHRRELSGRWGWMLVSGIVDLSLAAVILIGLPETTAWAMGLIVGVNMVLGGVSMIGMALAARPWIEGVTPGN